MNSSQNQIDLVINSIFNKSGLKSAEIGMRGLNKTIESISQTDSMKLQDKLFSSMGNKVNKVSKGMFDFDKSTSKFQENLLPIEKMSYEVERLGGSFIAQGGMIRTGLERAGFREVAIPQIKQYNSQIKKAMDIKDPVKKMDVLSKTFRQFGYEATKVNNAIGLMKIKHTKASKAMVENAKKMKKSFSMHFLGIMFGGMALQKMFMTMATIAQESFMRITEGQGAAAESFHALNASMELVKFSIGNAIATALQPYLPLIIEIAEKISDWVGNNQKLIAGLVIGGIVLGTLALTIGQAYLFAEALTNWLGPKGVYGKLMLFAKAHPVITAIVVALAIMSAVVLSIPITREKFVDILKESKKQLTKTVNHIMNMLFGSIELKDTWIAIGSVFVWLFAIIAKGLEGFLMGLDTVVTALVTIKKAMTIAVYGVIMLAVEALKLLIEGLNFLPGVEIDTSFLSKGLDLIGDEVDSIFDSIINDWKGLWDNLVPSKDLSEIITAGPLGTYDEFKQEELEKKMLEELNEVIEETKETNDLILKQTQEENDLKAEKIDLIGQEIDLMKEYNELKARYGIYSLEDIMTFEEAKRRTGVLTTI